MSGALEAVREEMRRLQEAICSATNELTNLRKRELLLLCAQFCVGDIVDFVNTKGIVLKTFRITRIESRDKQNGVSYFGEKLKADGRSWSALECHIINTYGSSYGKRIEFSKGTHN